jgi:MoaA/NifB/PqqE/SkfB family radical SAM enzyme
MRSVILNIGTSCFVQCHGCYNHFANSIKNQTTVSDNDVLQFVRNLSEIGISKITIGGGDPLSRPAIHRLLKDIKALGITINLDTVGTAFIKPAPTIFFGKLDVPKIVPNEILDHINVIGIPLDGSTNEIVSIFRKGRQNLFDEQMVIIKLLNSYKAKVCVNTVVHNGNKSNIEELYHLLIGENICKWQLFQFMPIGELGYKNRQNLAIADHEFASIRQRILSLAPPFEVEFKTIEKRKQHYLIIDDEGMAWLPTDDEKREIIGSIQTHSSVVINYLLNE